MDYDADGDLDILSGSYTGEIYLFERREGGGFAQGRCLLDADGRPLQTGTSVTPEAVDMDGDRDLDLVIGTRTDGVYVVENVGTSSKPAWSPKLEPLLTEEGERVKGSNAHHADWDGDGLDDLIVGSEWGGASWHRNTGTANAPTYSAAETLVGRNRYEERSESEGPLRTGLRTKVHVTDWNGDGRPDLLVGDVQWLYETLPPLSADQEAERDALTPAFEAARARYREAIDERNASVRAGKGILDEVRARMEAAQEALAPLSEEMSAFDRRKTHTHGWVWLYVRGPENATGRNDDARERVSQTFGPATLEVIVRRVTGDAGRLQVESTLRLDTGWHVYAEVPGGSPYPATRPSLTSADGSELVVDWKTVTTTSPDPKDVARSWYTGAVTFTCEVRLPDAGESGLGVNMHFQACTEEQCLPPKTLAVELGACLGGLLR